MMRVQYFEGNSARKIGQEQEEKEKRRWEHDGQIGQRLRWQNDTQYKRHPRESFFTATPKHINQYENIKKY